ncbi:treponemal membrane protein B-like [Palaemon carinicauda]|uniref:treponemal membrane protein B-like n=1 Tax=Palaemon carinicauda TaxID=392227 RepID=UPI0035B641C7
MSERSLKSRTSSKSDTSEVRRKLLEAQANLAKVQLKARLEVEERAAKKKAEADELAAQRDAEDRAARGLADAALLEAKLEVQRQQLEYEIRLEAGESQCGSEVSSHAGSVRVPSVKAVETEHESRINQWRLSVDHHHENDPTAMRTMDPVEHTRRPEGHSTPMKVHSRPLDPTSTPFAP